MNNIDERVVEMRFDNKQFESGISTSINSIDKLKKSLNFNSTSKELSKFEKASNSMRFDGLKNSFNTAVNDMSVWAIAKFQLVSRAIDKVTSSAERCIKSMSVDQVAQGWKKFEDKTTAVATLIAQGYDMSTIEQQLSKLNWYTDETSYAFADMAKNIAQFTAAGQPLPESVTALMGIANWAATAGQNAQTASRAMYQISQAMGAGIMRKEDWKSIQNASMDTQEFRQHAIDAAISLGQLTEVGKDMYRTLNGKTFSIDQFADNLTEGAWFTSDVMMEVFNAYSSAVDDIYAYTEENGMLASEAIEALGDSIDAFGVKAFLAAQEARSWTDVIDATKDAVSTGWMNIFETIFGNYEEQKQIWGALVEEMYTVFAEPLNNLNGILKEWKELGGRTDVIEGIANIFNTLKGILGAIRDAFRDLFPKKTAMDLKNITSLFAQFSRKLVISEDALDKIRSVARALFVPLRILINVAQVLLTLAGGLVVKIIDIVKNFKTYSAQLQSVIQSNEKLNAIFEKLKDAIAAIRSIVAKAKEAIIDFVQNFNGMDSVAQLAAKIVQAIQSFGPQLVQSGIDIVRGLIQGIGQGIPKIAQSATTLAKSFVESFQNYMQIHSPSRVMIALGGFIVAGLLVGIFTGLKSIKDSGKTLGQGLVDGFKAFTESDFVTKIKEAFTELKGVFAQLFPKFNAWLIEFKENLTLGRIASLGFATAIVALSLGITKAIVNVFSIFKGAAKVLNNFGELVGTLEKSVDTIRKSINRFSRSAMITSFALAIGVIVASMVVLSLMPAKKALVSAGALAIIILSLSLTLAVMSKMMQKVPNLEKNLESFTKFFLKFAAALAIASVAMLLLAIMPTKKAIGAAVSLGILMTAMGATCRIINKVDKDISKTSKAMIPLAASLIILTVAMKKMVNVSKGLDSTGWISLVAMLVLVLGTMAILSAILSNVGDKPFAAAMGMLALTVTLSMLVGIFKRLSKINFSGQEWAAIAINFAAISAALLVLSNILGQAGNSALEAGVGILALVLAFTVLANNFKKLTELTFQFKDLFKFSGAMLLIIGVLVALILATNIPTGEKQSGIFALVAAIVVLIAGLALLSREQTNIGKVMLSALALGGIIAAIAFAMKAAEKVSKSTWAILALTLAISAIVSALIVLQLWKPKDLLSRAGILVGLIGALALAVFAASKIKDNSPVWSVIALVGMLAVLTIAITYLVKQKFETAELFAVVFGLTICIAAMSLMLVAASSISDAKPVWTILAMVVAMAAVVAAIKILETVDQTALITAAACISGVILILSVAALIANNAMDGAIAMIALAASSVIVAASLLIMTNAVSSSGWQSAVIAAGVISATMLLLATSALVAQNGILGAVAMIGLAAAAAIVAGSLALMVAVTGDGTGLIKAALAIVIALGALSAIAAVLGLALPVVAPGTAILAAFAAIILVVAAAMAVGAIAFNLFAFGLQLLAVGIAELTPLLPLFAISVAMMIQIVTQSLITGAQNLGTAGFILMYSAGYNIVAGLTTGIMDGISAVIESAGNMASTFFNTVCKVLGINSPAETFKWIAEMCLKGISNGTESNIGEAISSGELIGNATLSGISSKIPEFFASGQASGDAYGQGLIGTIQSYASKIGIDFSDIFFSKDKEQELTNAVSRAKAKLNIAISAGESAQNIAALRQEVGRTIGALNDYNKKFNYTPKTYQDLRSELSATTDQAEETSDMFEEFGADGLGGGGGGSSPEEEVEDVIQVFYQLDKAIGKTAANYKKLDTSLSDDDATSAATKTVLGFAMALATAAADTDESGEDIQLTLADLEQAFADYSDSVKSSVESQMDVFKEFNKGDFLNADAIIKDLDSQINGVQSFIYMIDQLSKREIDPQLLKSIVDMGPENGYAYAEAFYNATDDKLKSLNSKYELFGYLEESGGDALTMSLAEAFKDSDYRFGDLGSEAGQELLNTFAEALGDGDATEISDSMSELFEKVLDGFDPSTLDRAVVELPPVVAILDATVDQVSNDYKKLNDNLSDSDAINSATDAVLSFAISLAAASQETDEVGNKIELTLEDLEQSLKDYKKSLQDTVESQIDLFGEFDKGSILNSDDIVKSFKNQISGIQEFMYMVDQLSKKELDPRLLQSIIEMGPESGYAYAEMFYSMSDTAIKEMNSTYGMWNDIRDAVSDGMLSVIAEAYAGTVYSFGDLGQEAGSELLKSLAETFKEANIDENDLSQGIVSVWEKIFEGFDPSTLGRKLLDKSDVYTIDKYTNSIAKDYKKLGKTFDRDIAVSSASDAVLGFALSLQYTSEEAEYSGEAIEFTLEELESALADYEDSIQSTAESQLSLFHEFEKGDILTFEEVMKSFDSQIKGLNEFMDMIDALSKKGLDPQFIKDIVDMGPEAGYQYAEVFMNATDKQIQEANAGYRARSSALSTYGETMVSSVAKSFADSATPFGELGAQAGQIVIGGLKAELSTISEYGPELAAGMQKTIDTAKEIVESDPDDVLTVTLVVDDEDAQESLRALGNSVGGHLGFNLGVTDALAQSFASKDEDDDDDGYYGDTTITNNNITQNFNYEGSKPLTPVEIYRHTHRAVK